MENFNTSDDEYDVYVGLDIHKATIAVAVTERGKQPARFRSEISNTSMAIRDLTVGLESSYLSRNILYCYESCWYVL